MKMHLCALKPCESFRYARLFKNSYFECYLENALNVHNVFSSADFVIQVSF